MRPLCFIHERFIALEYIGREGRGTIRSCITGRSFRGFGFGLWARRSLGRGSFRHFGGGRCPCCGFRGWFFLSAGFLYRLLRDRLLRSGLCDRFF